MKNTDNFGYERKLSCATNKLTLFAVRDDEMEDTAKSMKNISKGNSSVNVGDSTGG